ncbi:MAG: tetratricopeptide repeat protein [Candidatus Eremiobacteraeota bacterium]|nr:tetratricopeptide repeat protein [Candidatus Eremiobacteraeota bacterium]
MDNIETITTQENEKEVVSTTAVATISEDEIKDKPAEETTSPLISDEAPGETPVEEKEETHPETGSKQASEKFEREKNVAIKLERNAEYFAENLKFDEALESFRQSASHYRKINDRQSIARIHYRTGFCYEQQQKYNEAVKSYMEAKRIFLKMENMEDYSTVSDRLAKTHYFQNKIDDAVAEYEEVIENNCITGDMYNNFGFILLEKGEMEKARESLEKSIKMREGLESEEIHLSYNNLGVVDYIQGNYDKAIENFKTGLELDKRDAKDDRTIQFTVFMKPEFKEEKFTDHKVFPDVNTKACLMLNLAAAQGMNGDMKSAVETCQEALTLDKDRPYLYEAAGWIYINADQEKRAIEYFRRATPYDSANEELKKVITMINPYIGLKVGRNETCPCGSGKKYKKCHGAVV